MAKSNPTTVDAQVTALERQLAESADRYRPPPAPKPARVVDGVVHLRPVNERDR